MSADTLLAAGLFCVVSSVTPGPSNTMLMASGVNFGFRRAQPHLWGVNLGVPFMLLCVGLGLHSVLDRFPQFYEVLRYLGSAYMLWLAWKLASAQPGSSTDRPTDALAQPMGFWTAAAFQWVNPKAWVMAVTFMSTYLAPNADIAQVALLTSVYLVLAAPCSALWLGFGQAMRGLLQDPLRMRIFNITMALALVASLYPMLRR
jgi:threonine/homoserine/homoserine lactone efflux protein